MSDKPITPDEAQKTNAPSKANPATQDNEGDSKPSPEVPQQKIAGH